MDMAKIFHDCWEDTERMRWLFSEFRSKSLNPHGWDEKMSIWKQAINEWCRQKRKLRFTQDELFRSFELKGSYPQCLQTVLEEMSSDNCLTTTSEFQSRLGNQGWMAWGVSVFVKQPIVWGWSMVRDSVLGTQGASGHEYFNINILKEMSITVLQRLEDRDASATIPCSVFHNECKSICPDFDDFYCIVLHLQHEGNLAVFVQDGQKLIKATSKKSKKVSLTEADIGVVRLQRARLTVEKEIEKLKAEIARCKQDALLAVKSGFRNKAEVLVAKKQRTDKQLDKKMATLDNIDKMMEQLQQTDSNKEVMQAYQSGVAALKSTVQSDLNLDKIDDTMFNIEDTLDLHAEIQATLSRSLGAADDAELEAELDQLLQDEESLELNDELRSLKLDKSIEIQFPKVPDDSPSKSEEKVPLVH